MNSDFFFGLGVLCKNASTLRLAAYASAFSLFIEFLKL